LEHKYISMDPLHHIAAYVFQSLLDRLLVLGQLLMLLKRSLDDLQKLLVDFLEVHMVHIFSFHD